MIQPFKKMTTPNESLVIFKGEFELSSPNEKCKVVGEIRYTWFPYPRVGFEGKALTNDIRHRKLLTRWAMQKVELTIQIIAASGHARYTGYTESGCKLASFEIRDNEIIVTGTLPSDVVFGDTSINVDQLHFDLPNLRGYLGLPVFRNRRIHSVRMKFRDSKYKITIDRVVEYDAIVNKLTLMGGYATLHSGTIASTKRSIAFEETKAFPAQWDPKLGIHVT